MQTRLTVMCAATLMLALTFAGTTTTWAFRGAGPGDIRAGGPRGSGHFHHGRVNRGDGAFIHDRIGSGFAEAVTRDAYVQHQRQLYQAFRRSGLIRDNRDFHAHHPYPGSVPYRGYSGGYGRYGHQGGSITIISPPPVILVSPYFCEVCAAGFDGDRLFYSHLQKFHGVPPDALDSACIAVGDQLVFAGY